MKTHSFIVNPKAGGGRAARLIATLERQLEAWGTRYTLDRTEGPGDATRLASGAPGDVVVAVGGDGTINEVLNGLPAGKMLGIIPAGSGNDLVKSLPIPARPLEALHTAVHGKARRVDVGTVDCEAGTRTETSGRLFLNGVGIGFDAEVAVRKGEIRFLSGPLVYVAAVLQTLGKYRAPVFDIRADGISRSSKQLLVAVGNGRCAGGGFYLTPGADPSDGQLDVCLIENVGIITILRLMPRVMVGKHVGHPSVQFTRTRDIRLESASPFYVHADGEIVGHRVKVVRIGLLPGHVQVIVRDRP